MFPVIRLSLHFNPHEREARDPGAAGMDSPSIPILIHTSVKLVTVGALNGAKETIILIHTSVKLVTHTKYGAAKRGEILIHTSVKLVTPPTLTPL